MSLSVEERRDNIDFALKLLLENIGNRAIGAFHIVSNAPEYSGIYPTTWHELVNKNYLQQIPGFPGRCTFTGFGLRSALELCGMQEPLKEMLGRMCKHLKDSISRNRGTSVSVNTLAQNAKLQPGFIINAIEAQLIDYWLNRHGASWVPAFVGSVIMVPANFGLERL